MEKIHRCSSLKWFSCKLGILPNHSKTQAKRNKKPANGVLLLFSWCLCILSLRNFRNQLIHMRNYDAIKHDTSRVLIYTSRPNADGQGTTVDTPIRIATLKAVTRTDSQLLQTSHNIDILKNVSIIRSNIEKTGAISYQRSGDTNIGGALCIKSNRWYGRTFNRILELANALAIIADDVNNNTTVSPKKQIFIGLSPNLSEWYETFLDSRRDIVLNYTGPCVSTWTSKDLFFIKEYKNSRKSRQQLQHLIPKKDFRDEAEQALEKYSNGGQREVVTVHRRHLEGVCSKKAMGVSVACVKDRVLVKRSMSTNELLDTCNYNYSMIHNKHKQDLEQNKSVVVLCTDQQVPQLDDTFPIRSNYSFPVEAWIMAKSDVHYGNPHSTVDLVVAVWRTGQNRRTQPEQCYEED